MPTRTVRQAGGDFSTLASALADAGTVAGDTISIEEAWTIDDTVGAVINDDDISILTDNDAYHNGVFAPANNDYRLVVSSGATCLTVNNDGAIIDRLALVQAGGGISDECIRIAIADATIIISNGIIRSTTNTADQDGIFSSSSGVNVTIENCIIYGFARAGIQAQVLAGFVQTWNLNSITIWDCALDLAESGAGGISLLMGGGRTYNVNIFNTCILDCNSPASDDYNEASAGGTGNWDIHNSIDSDGSITGRDPGAVGAIQNRIVTDNGSPGVGDFVIFEDITTTPFDLLLQDNSVDNDAQDAHSATSGAGRTLPILDIAGDIRERGANEIDVGADSIPNPPVDPGLPEYGQGRAAIGDPLVYGATIVRS